MVKKVINPINFGANNTSNKPKKHKYQDPLNKKVPVLMSYSNEVGTAISEIAPKLGMALWAPTFMYLGADIYDKYKNDKDNYNPSARRALKRAIFQGLTSLVALPAVIFAAQSAISPLAQFDKWGISGNTKDAIYKHTKSVIDQAHGDSLASYENFREVVLSTLENKMKARNNEKRTINTFKKLYNLLFTERYAVVSTDKAKILAFAEDNARKTYDLLIGLKHNDKKKVPHRIYQKSQIFKNKLLKTFGGITALVLLANPINAFVEKQIMKKFISPGIDQISREVVSESKIKNIFNNMPITNSDEKNGRSSNLLANIRSRQPLKSKAVEN